MLKRLDNRSDFVKLCQKIGVSDGGIAIMKEKSELFYLYALSLKTPACNILKQEMLSLGADVAVSRDTVNCKEKVSDALLVLNKKQIKALAKKLKAQPFGLKELSNELESFLVEKEFPKQLMGVLNANDDSFYHDSRFSADESVKRALVMIEDGADIIDIGGVSSRPGSEYVGEDEEFARIKPVVDALYHEKIYEKVELSLDSFSPKCLEYALDRGFCIANDITALEDDEVAKVIAKYGAKVVLMHKKGSTVDMQENPHYQDVLLEVEQFFHDRVEKAKSFGIKDIVLDVGIGFGKRLKDNIALIKNLEHFKKFGLPLLVGVSRKSMIDMITPCRVEDRLAGSLTLHQESLRNGASIIRVHDVKEHRQMMEVFFTVRSEE